MYILTLVCGSASIKYKLFDTEDNFRVIAKGQAEKIGETHSLLRQQITGHQEIIVYSSFPEHCIAIRELLAILIHDPSSPINNYDDISAVGHMVIHGGEKFKTPVVIDDDLIESLRKPGKFNPLCSRPNLVSIEEARHIFPQAQHIAVFDTALHQTLQPKAFLYGLPIEYYEKYGVRKYGFGGINDGYVAACAAGQLQNPLEDIKLITCHLSSRCSVTAFLSGKSIDTSMGLSSLEGLMTPSQCGDMDPSVLLHLLEARHLYPTEIDDLLNRNCGLKGLCGKNDMGDVLDLIEKNDTHAKNALDVFIYRIQKYIGAYIAAMNGLDAIVFTGEIGEAYPVIRKRVMENFSYMNAMVDDKKNENNEKVFSTNDSKVCLMNIPENEEIIIAKQTYEITEKIVTSAFL